MGGIKVKFRVKTTTHEYSEIKSPTKIYTLTVRKQIILRVNKAKFFTLVADEVTDISNREQLSLVVRYVNEDDSQICEDFITFLECESGVSGQAIADMMVSFLKPHGLNPANLCGQAYDGAGIMSGKTNGAVALIISQYPLALFVPCASHRLNLAVVKSLEEVYIRNMIGVVNRVYLFFSAHPKCQKNLEETIAKYQPDSSIHKLKDLCRTHWIERIDGFDHFCVLHSSLVACMESIAFEGASKWSADSLTDARTLLLAITTTEFV